MNHDELGTLLISKPKEILDRELSLIELTTSHAEDRRIADEIKTLAKNDAAMNLSFKNEEHIIPRENTENPADREGN